MISADSQTPIRGAYLDWAASTPIRPEALAAMVDAAESGFGNPSGIHKQARVSRRIVDTARDRIADYLNARPADVIFCGSGTEADNLAILGGHGRAGGLVLCSAVEHAAVLRPVEKLGGKTIAVNRRGKLELDHLETLLREAVAARIPVCMVSVMLVNNESGVIQPLEPVRELLDRFAPDALLHTDAIQAFPWVNVAELADPADLVSISGHKIGGPKGVGALVARKRNSVIAQVLGGGQELGLRSGTHNVAGIAGFGVAAEVMVAERDSVAKRVSGLRDRLVEGLMATVPGTLETAMAEGVRGPDSDPAELSHVDRSHKVAGSAHLCFPEIEGEALLFLLERSGVSASAGSSCASGAQHPSHVLHAMGYSAEVSAGAVRLSLGYGSTEADVQHVLQVLPKCVAQLHGATHVRTEESSAVDSLSPLPMHKASL